VRRPSTVIPHTAAFGLLCGTRYVGIEDVLDAPSPLGWALIGTSSAVAPLVPRLMPGARLERKPVIADSEFRWGYVLTTPRRPEGIECSSFVAVMLSHIDGRASIGELVAKLRGDSGQSQGAQIKEYALAALEVLYIEGAIAELQGLANTISVGKGCIGIDLGAHLRAPPYYPG
jgi:hypothetical protein